MQPTEKSSPLPYEAKNFDPKLRIKYRILNEKEARPIREIYLPVDQAEIDQLVELGYLVLPGLIQMRFVEELRQAIDSVYLAEETNPEFSPEPCIGGHYLRHLIEKHPVFLHLFHLEKPIAIARAVLGPQVQFDEIVARRTDLRQCNSAIPWHIHHRVIPDPLPPFFAYPHAINCLIYLDDVDTTAGPLCVIPGSHKQPLNHIPGKDFGDKPGQQVLPASAGTAVLIHANLWHRSIQSQVQNGFRRLLILGYLPAWLRTEEAAQHTPEPKVIQRLQGDIDPDIRELAGDFRWG